MKISYIFLVIVLALTACERDEPVLQPDYSSKELVITTGYVCGWCSGADSLVLVDDAFSFVSYNPCDQTEVRSIEKGEVSSSDWQSLVQLLDFETFSEININTCHVCADGCDRWVRIRQGEETHLIRFWNSEDDLTATEPVQPFLDKLEELKAKLISE